MLSKQHTRLYRIFNRWICGQLNFPWENLSNEENRLVEVQLCLLCSFTRLIFRCEILLIIVRGDNETMWDLITFQHRQFRAAIITPAGGLLIDDAGSKYHSGTNGSPPSQGKQRNEHNFNQLQVMDLTTKSFLLRFMAEEERRMQSKLGLRGDVFVCELSCKQELSFAVIWSHLMISECDRTLGVNLEPMKGLTTVGVSERGSLVCVFRVGPDKWALSISGVKKEREKARRGTPTSLSWIMSSTSSDKWTVEWERTPWNQIEYGLLGPGFIARGCPWPGSHKLMQKWGVSGGLLLWFVYCLCHDGQYKRPLIVVPQQGSLIEYTQVEVKGRD